jgi:hypothetical protein
MKYQLCVRSHRFDNSQEICFYFGIDEFQDMLAFIKTLQDRTDEHLGFEFYTQA